MHGVATWVAADPNPLRTGNKKRGGFSAFVLSAPMKAGAI